MFDTRGVHVIANLQTYLHTRGVAGRERKRRFALVGDEIRRHGVGNMDSYVCVETATSLPILHVCAAAKLFGKVVGAILPWKLSALAVHVLEVICNIL
jgi:hypothetical protein